MTHFLGDGNTFETSGTNPLNRIDTIVLVVGAGVVGLTGAILLASQGYKRDSSS